MVPCGSAQLIEVLLSHGLLDERRLEQLLGTERYEITLPQLEARLVRDGVVSPQRLLLLKALMTGLPALEDDAIDARAVLPERVARDTGAVVLDLTQPTVAFVEPNDDNVRIVREALQNMEFTVWIITTAQFQELLAQAYRAETGPRVPEARGVLELLDECVKRKGTDLHLQTNQVPTLRVNGHLSQLPFKPLTAEWMERAVAELVDADGAATLAAQHTVDFAYSFGQHRFRVNLGHDSRGVIMAFRLLASSVPTMEHLALPAAVRAFTELERGLVLVTGPTGSGKSTTLASVIDHIAQHRDAHIITLEDPIEYLLTAGGASVVNQRELARDFTSFPAALRQALRQDPDIIFVGELRDAETAATAVMAAETGHLVFSTLHTYDAQSSVERLIGLANTDGDLDTARQKVAYLLKGVVSQTLLPRATATGRVAAHEIMVTNPAIQNNLKNPGGMAHLRSTIQTSRKEGMQTMEMALASLVLRGLVRQDEAEFRARDLEEFHRYLANADPIGRGV